MSNSIPFNPDHPATHYPPPTTEDLDDQRTGLSQRADLVRNHRDEGAAFAPWWGRSIQDLRARGVNAPTHKDLFSRSRLNDEARVSFEYFKAVARMRAIYGPRHPVNNRFLNYLAEFKRMLAACPNLRRSHVGCNNLLNRTGFQLIQLSDVLNGLSGISMNAFAFRNQHPASRSSLIYRWTRTVPAIFVNALGAYVISRGVTELVDNSALKNTALDTYKGAYLFQVLSYGTGAALRVASQLLSNESEQSITPEGLEELQSIFFSTLNNMRTFHTLIQQEPHAFENLRTVFLDEFAGNGPQAVQCCDSFLEGFKLLPEVNLVSLSDLIATFLDEGAESPVDSQTRASYITRLFQLASHDLRSGKIPGDLSIRNQVEAYFHELWGKLNSDRSADVLHTIRQRPERSGDLPRALVAAGDKTEQFAGSVAFSLDGIAGRYLRERLIETDQGKANSRIDPIAAHGLGMMLNVAAYGLLAIEIARSSKKDGYSITPKLPSDDDFQASLSATSLLMLYMSFSVMGLVFSTLGAGLEKASQSAQTQDRSPSTRPNPVRDRVMSGKSASIFKAMVLLSIGVNLPLIKTDEGKQPTALLGLLSGVFLGLGLNQLLTIRSEPRLQEPVGPSPLV